MPKQCCAADMYMDYTIDHVRVSEPATNEKRAPLPKKIWTGLGNQPSITPIQCGDLDGDQNDTVKTNQTESQHGNRRSQHKPNYTDWADRMNTNHQLVRGNYTAKADSMGAGQIGGSQKSLLWDKTDTMLSADRRKTGETEA